MGDIISFNQYDKRDRLINTYTSNFDEFLKKVPNCKDYYYRLLCYKDTNRKIVSDVYFGCNVSNIGSLNFNIPDYMNAELNRRIQQYDKMTKNDIIGTLEIMISSLEYGIVDKIIEKKNTK